MNNLIRLTLALAGVVSASAFAADAPQLSAADVAYHATGASKLAELSKERAAPSSAALKAGTASAKAMGNSSYPGSPQANAFRAYPPSCAADPLPDKASGPYYSAQVPLFVPLANGGGTTETVTVTVWRLACSSSGTKTLYNPTGAYNAITLMRIDRSSSSTTNIPTFPIVQVSQGDIGFGTAKSLVRVATEPNTVISDTPFNSAVNVSTTYVLENYPYQGSGYFTFSDAFKLRIDPYLNGVTPFDISVPAYSPTRDTYPDAYNPLPLDGYMSGNWYDPAHGGEGIVIEVAEQVNGSGNVVRPFVFDWYTFDSTGTPFWLAGDGIVDPNNPLSVSAGTGYRTGGGFAGNFNATTLNPWGTVTFQFIDCNTIKFTYQSNNNLPNGVPAGSGERTWTRLTNVNGLTCE
jgi:hypothetical protein